MKVALRGGDLVAAGHYQHIIDELFSAEEDDVADPVEISEDESEADAVASRSNRDALAIEDRGEAGDDD